MKIHSDDRGITPVPKAVYTTIKQSVMATLKHCFEEDLAKLDYEMSLSFVSDEEMRELNLKYREKDAPTDVLSFPTIDAPPAEGFFSMGDIVISTETAARQAEELGHSLERELAFLAVHGVLHLLGLDHETSANEKTAMEEIQTSVLDALGVSR